MFFVIVNTDYYTTFQTINSNLHIHLSLVAVLFVYLITHVSYPYNTHYSLKNNKICIIKIIFLIIYKKNFHLHFKSSMLEFLLD